MTRLVAGVFVAALSAGLWPVAADDPPAKLTPEERKQQEAKWLDLMFASHRAYQDGKIDAAVKACEDGLRMAHRLWPKDQFPDGHDSLATNLGNLAYVYQAAGKFADAEPLYTDALAMRRRLFPGDHEDVALSLNNLGLLYDDWGRLAEAEPLLKDALAMRRRLHTGDHPTVADSLNNVAGLYQAQGKLSDAEPLYKDALEMFRRLIKGDHPHLAFSMNNLSVLYKTQGRLAEAEALATDALAMRQRLFKGDHPAVARGLNNLAVLYEAQGKLADAETLHREALAMNRRVFKGDHPAVALSLSNLAAVCSPADAETLHKEALAMRRRLFDGDHPDVAMSLSNLGRLYQDQDKLADAETLTRDALAMRRRLFKGDHPDVADSLNNLGYTYLALGKFAPSEQHLKDALAMSRRLFGERHPNGADTLNNLSMLYLIDGRLADADAFARDALRIYRDQLVTYAQQKAEGEALTLLARMPGTRSGVLMITRRAGAEAAGVYAEVWADKAAVARIYEQRQQAARAATDPMAAKLVAELADARRRRAELILAPEVKDPLTRKQRDTDIRELAKKIDSLDRDLRPLLPVVERAERLTRSSPADLQKALPENAAVVDFLAYSEFEFDNSKPVGEKETRTRRYTAFVVTRNTIARIDVGPVQPIEAEVNLWREAITSGKEIPATVPAKVRKLVWDKVRKELPAGITTVYISPDMALYRVPWAALPGDKPGTILLEEYAIATIPHAPFLLDQLWPQDPHPNPPTSALIVGGVKYDADVTLPDPKLVALRGDPLLKPGQKLAWGFLPNTVGELNGVATLAAKKRFPVTRYEGDQATTAAVLEALPKAKVAHFATHGFFADPSFRSVFQLDPKHFEQSRRGERVGAGALSPLVMTGLVLAGANNPKTPGRGIVTGELLIDRDLSGLELAVLSACETGLGDVAGGEGTFGLQRAFQYAGTKNVVASLWKVPDAPTAALMNLFYTNLWEKNLSPLAALRAAQLEIYRNPKAIPTLAAGFRGKFEEVKAGADQALAPTADGKAHPLQWAAFTLSGAGR